MKDSSRRQFLKGIGVTGGALTMGGFPLAETSSVRQDLDSGSAQPNSEGMGKTNEAIREWPKVEQIRDKILDLEALKNVAGFVRCLGIA